MKQKRVNKLTEKRFVINISILILIIIILFAVIFFKFKNNSGILSEGNSEKIFDFKEVTPEEISKNKEKYEGKLVKIINAIIPSEAFIYIKNNSYEDRIFINPPNKIYCRNFNLKGKLEKNESLNKWILNIIEFECLKKN